MSLLSGACNARNSVLAQQIYTRIKEHFPQLNDVLASGLTLLGNVYRIIGDVEKANDIRRELNESGLRKKAALSRTVINGQIYASIIADLYALNQIHLIFPGISST